MKTTKLPSKVYEPEWFDSGFKEIIYFPKKNSSEENTKILKLPSWLSILIKEQVELAVKRGEGNVISQFRDILRI